MLLRVGDPAFQLRAGRDRAGRVVWETEVDHVGVFVRRLGHEVVFRAAGEVDDAFVAAALVRQTGVAGHHVGIDVDRIDRIRDRDPVLVAEDIEDETAIALRAVGDENLVVRDLHPAVAIIDLRDFLAQEIAALLVAVAAEGFAHGKLVHRRLDRRHRGRRQRLGDVADAAADYALRRFRIPVAELAHPPRDLGEKVTGLELEVVFVEVSHVAKSVSPTMETNSANFATR